MIVWALAAWAAPLPEVSAETLSGQPVALPGALPAARTVLLLGFKQSHQTEFDAWRPELVSLAAEDVAWLELAFVDVPGFLKGIIGGAMNRTIRDPVQRDHFAPVWASPEPVKEALGIHTDEVAVLVLLDAAGDVVFRHEGGPTPAALAALRAKLAE